MSWEVLGRDVLHAAYGPNAVPGWVDDSVAVLPPPSLGGVGIGMSTDTKPDLVLGAPCMRHDIAGRSFVSTYQMLCALLAARGFAVPCTILLGVAEEQRLDTARAAAFERVGIDLMEAAFGMAECLGVATTVLRTSTTSLEELIDDCVADLGIVMDDTASEKMYLLRRGGRRRPSGERLRVNARVVACHTGRFLRESHPNHRQPVLVEDLQQMGCWRLAGRYDDQVPGYLAVVPVPALGGAGVMFGAPPGDQAWLVPDTRYSDFEGASVGFRRVLDATLQAWMTADTSHTQGGLDDVLAHLVECTRPRSY